MTNKLSIKRDNKVSNIAWSALGINTIDDRQGNSVSGFRLNCENGNHKNLNLIEWDRLYSSLKAYAYLENLYNESNARDFDDVQSPLQLVCKAPVVKRR